MLSTLSTYPSLYSFLKLVYEEKPRIEAFPFLSEIEGPITAANDVEDAFNIGEYNERETDSVGASFGEEKVLLNRRKKTLEIISPSGFSTLIFYGRDTYFDRPALFSFYGNKERESEAVLSVILRIVRETEAETGLEIIGFYYSDSENRDENIPFYGTDEDTYVFPYVKDLTITVSRYYDEDITLYGIGLSYEGITSNLLFRFK